MFAKLISAITGGGKLRMFERTEWERTMSKAMFMHEIGKLDVAERLFRRVLIDDMPDDCRLQTTYHLGMTMMWKDQPEESERLLEQAADLAEALGDLGRAISPVNMWAKSLEMRGETKAAIPVRQRHLRVTAAMDHLAWTEHADTGEVIHKEGDIRFPRSFGTLQRAERSFEAMGGMDGTIFYRAAPPRQFEVRITIWIGSIHWERGLRRLSDEAVFWLGMPGADYLFGNFEVSQPPHTGVRRLWPETLRDGASWRLETFFVPFGDTHIGLRVASVKDDYDPADVDAILADFDWPKTFP